MLSVAYAECRLCWVSFMLSVVFLIFLCCVCHAEYCYAAWRYADGRYATCRYAERRYAECRGAASVP